MSNKSPILVTPNTRQGASCLMWLVYFIQQGDFGEFPPDTMQLEKFEQNTVSPHIQQIVAD